MILDYMLGHAPVMLALLTLAAMVAAAAALAVRRLRRRGPTRR